MKFTPKEIAFLCDGKELSEVQRLNVSNKAIDEVRMWIVLALIFCLIYFKEYHSAGENNLQSYFSYWPTIGSIPATLQILGLEVCSRLNRLDASANALTTLDGIAACSALRWLSVAKNKIDSLDSLSGLEFLEVLNAAHNQLEGKIRVGCLRTLKALILNNNNGITSVGGLDKLKDLDTLVLSNNAISSLGGWLSGAKRLQKLSLSGNTGLSDLGSALKNCTRLQELRLNHCHLTHLPSCLEANSKLRIIEVGGNQISTHNEISVLKTLPCLRQLNLKGCPVAELPEYAEKVLEIAPRLEVLDSRRVVHGAGPWEKRGAAKTLKTLGSAPQSPDDNPFDEAKAKTEPAEPEAESILPSQNATVITKEGKKRHVGVEGSGPGKSLPKKPKHEIPNEDVDDKSVGKKNKKPAVGMMKKGRVHLDDNVEADDDVLDAAMLRAAPEKKKKVEDGARTGVMKVVEVSAKKKGRKKDAAPKDKKSLRGAAALKALLDTNGPNNVALPAWGE